MQYQDIIDFWFSELSFQQWFAKDYQLDQNIKSRFSDVHQRAAKGELFSWRETAHGRLAEIIVLDQFSRNIYRDQAEAFACDIQALTLAQEAVAHGFDKALDNEDQRSFVYIPYMHSESLLVHKEALTLYASLENQEYYKYEVMHHDIIEEFGRYPHRNELLGREATQAEKDYLAQGGHSF